MSARAFRLDTHLLTQLLDELDAQGLPASDQQDSSAEPQFPYRVRSLHLSIRQADGANSRATVHARAISQHGLTVLAPRSVALGTPCEIYPIDTTGAWQVCAGKVSACAALDGHPDIWELRIQLENAIDVVRYSPSAWRTNVLVVDDSPAIRTLMLRLLPGYNADVVCVPDGPSAIKEATSRNYDLILLDIEMPGMNGIEVARVLREKGCMPPIVIVTATSPAENRDACVAAGCESFISKPIESEEISDLVQMVRPPPLVSALDDDQDSHTLVNEYVSQIRGTVDKLMTAYAAGDRRTITTICRHICAEAPTCGFPSLFKLAASVLAALETGFPMSDVRRPLNTLLRNLRAARPASNFEPVTPSGRAAAAPQA